MLPKYCILMLTLNLMILLEINCDNFVAKRISAFSNNELINKFIIHYLYSLPSANISSSNSFSLSFFLHVASPKVIIVSGLTDVLVDSGRSSCFRISASSVMVEWFFLFLFILLLGSLLLRWIETFNFPINRTKRKHASV